jgi:biotin synthase
VRRRHWGTEVQLYSLRNAKSGICPEDCGYCSQSKVSNAEIPVYRLNDQQTLMESARVAVQNKARTFCIVASGRGPTDEEVERVAAAVRAIKQELPLNVCCCLGLLTPPQARVLADAGVDRVNHNLNTSANHYEKICSTHSYADRLETLRVVREAGMELCSGGIIGLGESRDDVVDLAMALRELGVESIPVNFLHPIEGTPLANQERPNPRYCLKVLCMFRLTNPRSEIRVAGGRELNLRWLQPMALYAANSLFVSDYLTTRGQPAEADFQMIEDLGFSITPPGPETAKARAAAGACC